MRVALLGLGLIGGSIARALRAGGDVPDAPERVERLVAWTPSGAGPREAAQQGIVDAAPSGLTDAVGGADLIVLAAPPVECLGLLDRVASIRDRLARGVVVTDVASTKQRIVAVAVQAGLPFVGGHPMAGAERTGFAASSADLLRDRPWIVVPTDTSPAGGVERVEWLARACGARPVRLDAVTHDRVVAAISHVPLVLAVALVEAVLGSPGGAADPDRALADRALAERALEARLASSGWASMTRLALGSPEMGAGIVATNGPAIVAGLTEVRDAIDSWIVALESGGGDQTSLTERFRSARDRLAAATGDGG
jgi:prephenate dehydrogenase